MQNEIKKLELTTSEPLILNHEFSYALDQMEHSPKHIFISGKAGTGKSTLLKLFKDTSKLRIAVVAPTGVAALNIRGQTIHSFFRFPPRVLSTREIRKLKTYKMYKNMDMLIIDEISMVRADLLDNMDYFLRVNRGIDLPFGGVRLVLFGDLYQLPPVVSNKIELQYLTERYGTAYFFSSDAFKSIEPNTETIELHKVFRQSERFFINILERIRNNKYDREDLEEINSRVVHPSAMLPGSITLSPRNAVVDAINSRELAGIDKPLFRFPARVSGKFDPRIFPTDIDLKLKLGAQVMTLKNDNQRRYVNGSVGAISEINENTIKIKLIDDNATEQEIEVEKNLWEMSVYHLDKESNKLESEVIGTFEQYPIKLAWAITIHKSQGKTFERVYLDMGSGAFEYGQTYVALSRCKSLDGLQLKYPLHQKDILVDEKITDFYRFWQ